MIKKFSYIVRKRLLSKINCVMKLFLYLVKVRHNQGIQHQDFLLLEKKLGLQQGNLIDYQMFLKSLFQLIKIQNLNAKPT